MKTVAKRALKRVLCGREGRALRAIRCGLLRGHRFFVDPGCKSMRLLGLDEREIAGHIARLAAQVQSAVDVGANDGWYSLYFASRANVRNVYAFEPNQELHSAFEENFAGNDPSFRKKVQLIAKFAGAASGPQACKLDEVLREAPGPVLLKIDVDGGELEVLRGAGELLAGQPIALVVETHSAELEEACIGFLSRLGYQTRIVRNGWYRCLAPETRPIPHNRWFVAQKA